MGEDRRDLRPAHAGPRLEVALEVVGVELDEPGGEEVAAEVLGAGRKLDVPDMMRLQTDNLSIIARQLVPLLRNASAPSPSGQPPRPQ